MEIALKRAYDPALPDDGYRVYIDRLWPRGLSHETFHYDLWEKDIAPSNELREWFHQDPDGRWGEFAKRYEKEVLSNPVYPDFRKLILSKPKVTLLYSSHDETHNNALILRHLLLS